mgnify:CR=1 FL=1
MVLILLGIGSLLMLNMVAAESPAKGGKLRHVVAFKFKESATPEDIKKVETEFRNLKKKIKQIQSYEWGMNNSPEGLNKGTTHGFILTFNSEKDRDDYLVHPDHKEFGKLVGPLLADVFVIDFWAKE